MHAALAFALSVGACGTKESSGSSCAEGAAGTEEVCDGLDNDCDGLIDEGVLNLYYPDIDGDGLGDGRKEARAACAAPEGYSAEAGDCLDDDPESTGTNEETCNGIDDNCDGIVDNDASDASEYYIDRDGDGFGDFEPILACGEPENAVENGDDCDDRSARIAPGAAELCDGFDNDCDGEIDEDTGSLSTFYADMDADGFGDESTWVEACMPPAGYVNNRDDCDDSASEAWPGATEVCDGLDNDCDGQTDELGAQGATEFFTDADRDGYGAGLSLFACSMPEGYAATSDDCNDRRADQHPNQTELSCNGEDLDCDGHVDNDADGDGYPDAACGGTDCNDGDPDVYPGHGCYSSCKEILEDAPASVSGTYEIDLDGYGSGNAPLNVYCDMTTNGGGWTVCGKFHRDNAEGTRSLSHPFARDFINASDLEDVTSFTSAFASLDCRHLISNGATQILNVGTDSAALWDAGRIIDIPEATRTDPTDLWDIHQDTLNSSYDRSCTSDAIVTRDLDGVDVGTTDAGSGLGQRAMIIETGALWTNRDRDGARFSNAGNSNCTGTSSDTVYWAWVGENGSEDDHGCHGSLRIGTGCRQDGSWDAPTYNYNLMLMR